MQGTVEGKFQAKNVRLESTARVTGEVNYCDLNVRSGTFLEVTFRDESSSVPARIEHGNSWKGAAHAPVSA